MSVARPAARHEEVVSFVDIPVGASYRGLENFPGDSLADDALYEASRAYQSMWRKPELDKAYGESAIATAT